MASGFSLPCLLSGLNFSTQDFDLVSGLLPFNNAVLDALAGLQVPMGAFDWRLSCLRSRLHLFRPATAASCMDG